MPPQKHAANAMEIDRLATLLAKDPLSKTFLPLAEEYCKSGMWEEAVSVLEDGLKYYPGFITAMVVLGRAYDQLNQPTKARAVLEGAIKLSPENLRAHRTLIKIYTAQGLKQEALESCRVILTMNPKDAEALSAQASLAGQESQAEQESEHIIQEALLRTPSPVPTGAEAPPFASDRAPSIEPREDERSGGQTVSEHQSETTDGTDTASRHAETIAQLESWLRSLERQRRDRPTAGTPHSNL
jgi:tetratricopeptide (TPR) repeat protein